MVGTRRDAGLLLPDGGDLDEAVASGRLQRFKERGRWLYSPLEISAETALAEAERAAASCLREWLLGPTPILRNAGAKRTEAPVISGSAMDVLIRELAFRGRLAGLGLTNRSYQPYVSLYVLEDRAEIARQLAALRDLLEDHGRAESHELPAPTEARRLNAWRDLVLAHGEFAGLGWLASRQELIAW